MRHRQLLPPRHHQRVLVRRWVCVQQYICPDTVRQRVRVSCKNNSSDHMSRGIFLHPRIFFQMRQRDVVSCRGFRSRAVPCRVHVQRSLVQSRVHSELFLPHQLHLPDPVPGRLLLCKPVDNAAMRRQIRVPRALDSTNSMPSGVVLRRRIRHIVCAWNALSPELVLRNQLHRRIRVHVPRHPDRVRPDQMVSNQFYHRIPVPRGFILPELRRPSHLQQRHRVQRWGDCGDNVPREKHVFERNRLSLLRRRILRRRHRFPADMPESILLSCFRVCTDYLPGGIGLRRRILRPNNMCRWTSMPPGQLAGYMPRWIRLCLWISNYLSRWDVLHSWLERLNQLHTGFILPARLSNPASMRRRILLRNTNPAEIMPREILLRARLMVSPFMRQRLILSAKLPVPSTVPRWVPLPDNRRPAPVCEKLLLRPGIHGTHALR